MRKFYLLMMLLCTSIWCEADNKDVLMGDAFRDFISFSTSGTYEWEYDESNQCLKSTNEGIHSSTSTTTITISSGFSRQLDLSFNYKVSSESGYDKLTITIDGTTVVNGISGTANNSYNTTLSSGRHVLVLSYSKDSSANSGDDCASISNLLLLAKGTCGDNLSWVLDGEGALTISGTGNMENYHEWYDDDDDDGYYYDSPFSYHGNPYKDPFYDCGYGKYITSIVLGNGITSIGDYAFYGCVNISSIAIPSSVTSIGSDAFSVCPKLRLLTIPSSVTRIGAGALPNRSIIAYNGTATGAPWGAGAVYKSMFEDGDFVYENAEKKKLIYCRTEDESVSIPQSVTSIGVYAFYDCSSLTSVTIPNSVTSIGKEAFYYCSSLTKVNITDLQAWCNISFVDSYANPTYYAHKLYIDDVEVTDLVIPNSVTSIGSSAFYNCSSLTSVTIPNSVTSIGSYAFYGCRGLTSVTIPNSVTSIGSYAFYGCLAQSSKLDRHVPKRA